MKYINIYFLFGSSKNIERTTQSSIYVKLLKKYCTYVIRILKNIYFLFILLTTSI